MRIFALCLLGLSACAPDNTPPPSPVKAATVAMDGDLLTVSLTADAVRRLALELAPVERRDFPQTRLLAGEVLVPSDRSVVLSAPIAGRVEGAALNVGGRVSANQQLFALAALLTPDARAALEATRAEVIGSAANSRVLLSAADEALQRAERMLADAVGSERVTAEARAQRDSAKSALAAAEARREVLDQVLEGRATQFPILAPFAGRIQALHAQPGQQLAAGAALLELVDSSKVWIRVPIYVGEIDALDVEAPIVLDGRAATAIAAPPSANMAASTVDRFYAFDNWGEKLSPGERVFVELPLRASSSALSVPWSAIVHDSQGGTWVYERTAPETFVRRRVELTRRVEDRAQLARGPAPGTQVVATGAEELYGTEFGHAK
jgi:RND family efflux transporter MFP subunit